MAKIDKNKLGLTLGIFAALLHLVWAVLVAVGVAQTYLNWILPLHFVSLVVPIGTFSIATAIMLVILAFIGGYICGWLLAYIWSKLK